MNETLTRLGFSLSALAYNIKRAINLVGVPKLVAAVGWPFSNSATANDVIPLAKEP